MSDSDIVIDNAYAYQTYYWVSCSSCEAKVGPYFSMRAAKIKRSKSEQCSSCSFKAHYGVSHSGTTQELSD
jgi:hypothetical protein